jgi:FkbM family methyltransferase
MENFSRRIHYHKLRIKEAWNHKGNRGKRLFSLIAGYCWFFRSKITNRPKDIVVFGNMKFRCYPGSAHAQSIFFNGTAFDNWDSMHFINNVLNVNDRFIDIGANIGLFTLLADSKIGPGGYIIAIEPISNNISRLKENINLNNLNNVNVLQVGVSDKIGEFYFTDADVSSHMTEIFEEKTEKIKCIRLDDILESESEEFIVTKIDVEGMELLVFKGAEKCFEKELLPIIIFEVNGLHERYGIRAEEIYNYLKQKNYVLGYYNHDKKNLHLDDLLHGDTIAIKQGYIEKISSRYKDLKITYK